MEPALQGHLKLNIKNNHKIGRFARSATIEMTTRMHSSRMRTVHHSGRLGRGVSAQRGCLPRGCGGGVCLMALYTLPGSKADTPSSVNRITDRCKSITFPSLLLRTVINCLQGTHKAGGLRDCSHDVLPLRFVMVCMEFRVTVPIVPLNPIQSICGDNKNRNRNRIV